MALERFKAIRDLKQADNIIQSGVSKNGLSFVKNLLLLDLPAYLKDEHQIELDEEIKGMIAMFATQIPDDIFMSNCFAVFAGIRKALDYLELRVNQEIHPANGDENPPEVNPEPTDNVHVRLVAADNVIPDLRDTP